ncbi:hypothetical protein [Streptomyces indicus]|uniref:hypothetical protein n=1 Tax=Streptomyces indicus TaxID=417292 RepID=UPI00115FFFB5|nr:hypothetical protein [Streptomyces indicus]
MSTTARTLNGPRTKGSSPRVGTAAGPRGTGTPYRHGDGLITAARPAQDPFGFGPHIDEDAADPEAHIVRSVN